MPSLVITPVLVGDAPTAITQLSPGAPADEDWSVDIRATNKTAAEILYRLYLTPTADNVQALGAYGSYDYKIPANDARDIERDLNIPTGFKLEHRASAAGLAVRMTGRKRMAA